MDILLNTIRYSLFLFSIFSFFIVGNSSDEIAYCMEKSYRQVSLNEAARLLYLNKPAELDEITRKVKTEFSYCIENLPFSAWMETGIRSIFSFC